MIIDSNMIFIIFITVFSYVLGNYLGYKQGLNDSIMSVKKIIKQHTIDILK